MKIETKNVKANIPTWLILAGVLVLDNIYANHCKKKAVTTYLESTKTDGEDEEEEEEA